MRKVTDLVKKYPRRTILIVVAIFFIPLIIVHLLFKWNTSIEFLGAEWDAGDLLAYIAGFGIAGGIAVLVGGALLLGGGVGVGIGTLAASSSVIVLTELAKMEVVLKEIILGIQHDIQMMQEIIMNLNDSLNEMQKEVVKLKMENEKNKEKIKNLEESIEYLKKAIDEFQNMK